MTQAGSAPIAGYRGDGLHAWKSSRGVKTIFLYDGSLPLVEFTSNGTTNTVTAVNTFGANGLISRNIGGSSVFYTFDPQGNTAQRLDSSGNVLSSHFFDAYGAEYDAPSGTKAGVFGFGGQWGYYTDGETNLVLLTNRYYDPARGRFLTRDPAGYGGGTNLYGYVGNSPLSGIDPLGLCGDDAPDAFAQEGIDEVQAGHHAFWGGVRTVGRVLNAGIEALAATNPVTSVGIGINKLGEGNYGQAALFFLPAFSALGAEGGAAAEAAEAGEADGLAGRASEVHGVLDARAQAGRTTAVLQTDVGRIVGGGVRDLDPVQRGARLPGEIAARLPGAHAEITVLGKASELGVAPQAIGVSRPFCQGCREAIEASGGRIVGPRTAIWPRQEEK